MIYCVWYPSGGFGHFVNSVLNLYGQGFVRPIKPLTFFKNGSSHNVDYVAPPYLKDQGYYHFEFGPSNYSLIVDNGIINESKKFIEFFPDAKIIKMCYDDFSWPIVASTMIVKAMKKSIANELPIDSSGWDSCGPWVRREKFFLFLRDHSLRYAWKPDNVSQAINVRDLLDYNTMVEIISSLGITLEPFNHVWEQWFESNRTYIDPVLKSQDMLQGKWHALDDVWSQAVFYYQIWCKYGIEVPHNDYPNFFESQLQYQNWLSSAI